MSRRRMSPPNASDGLPRRRRSLSTTPSAPALAAWATASEIGSPRSFLSATTASLRAYLLVTRRALRGGEDGRVTRAHVERCLAENGA